MSRCRIWLCNRSHLNFLIYEENLIFFFISARRVANVRVVDWDCHFCFITHLNTLYFFVLPNSNPPHFYFLVSFKGTQDWEFFWLRYWNLRFFFVSYVKILRFYRKNFLIGSFLGDVRFFRVVLGLWGMKKFFELGQKKFIFLLPFWTLNMTQ